MNSHSSVGPAPTFAQVLRTEVKEGPTLAEAGRAARLAAEEAGEPTWLAYTIYGHPCTRLATEPAEATRPSEAA